MAIVKITDAVVTGPNVFVQPALNQLQALIADRGHGDRNTDTYILKGALFSINDELFRADSDTKINGTRFTSTFIKFTISGNLAIPSFADFLKSDTLTWSGAKQGWYDAGNNYYYNGLSALDDLDVSLLNMYRLTVGKTYADFTEGSDTVTVEKEGYYNIYLGVTSFDSSYDAIAYVKINGTQAGNMISRNTQTFVYEWVGLTHLDAGDEYVVMAKISPPPSLYEGGLAKCYLEPRI